MHYVCCHKQQGGCTESGAYIRQPLAGPGRLPLGRGCGERQSAGKAGGGLPAERCVLPRRLRCARPCSVAAGLLPLGRGCRRKTIGRQSPVWPACRKMCVAAASAARAALFCRCRKCASGGAAVGVACALPPSSSAAFILWSPLRRREWCRECRLRPPGLPPSLRLP